MRDWKLNEKLNKRYEETREVRGRLYFLPERFELDGKVQTELRARGIYQARLFHADNRISGRFVLPEQWGITGELLPITALNRRFWRWASAIFAVSKTR